MLEAIRLFPRINISGKADSIAEANEITDKLITERIHHMSQAGKVVITTSKRKRKPVDWELSFWEFKTLKNIAEYYDNKNMM